MFRIRRFLTVVVGVALVFGASPALAHESFPDVIDLPGGFFPEGIAIGPGSQVYTGSLVDGAIWKGDLRSGRGVVLVEGTEGNLAVGLDFDRGNLWVSGGLGAEGRVYDARTGDLLAAIPLGAGGFINDVIVTRRAAYFTNSFVPEIYEVPLDHSGNPTGPARTIMLAGDFQFEPGQFNANGIEATANGRRLIVVNSFFGEIYTVDPTTGEARLIDLGGVAVNGDGLVLAGRTLYAVEGSKNQITEIRLAPGSGSGAVVGALTSSLFDVPTTAARFGHSLYAVNAKFGTPPLPTTPYEIVRVSR